MKTSLAISILISTLATAAFGAACEEVTFEDMPFTVCRADPGKDDIRLFLNDGDGKPLGSFSAIEDRLPDGKSLAFAMNAGMYHPDRRPVGLYIENGAEMKKIVTRDGPGNFGLLPNGVLCLGERQARIIESRRFAQSKPACTHATQSGPMLVIDGTLHPRFLPNSTSRFRRNGVGVTPDGTLLAVISDRPVTFHRFARLFRDHLGTPNALFLDGKVSRLYAPGLQRHDIGFPMGPMLGVVETRK